MGRRLYVGNLPYRTTDEELSVLFGKAGAVESVKVMRDPATGRARGFAFVQMATAEGAQQAIAELHQFALAGRTLVVNEARPKIAAAARPPGVVSNDGVSRQPRW